MKKLRGLLAAAFLTAALSFAVCQPAFAVSEADVQAKVEASGKESVSGNLLIWFLCAIAFLKVSQKVDSFMSGLGINVGHTGGNMIAELMVAARGLGAAKNVAGGRFGFGGGGSGGSRMGSPGRNGSSGSPGGAGGFLSGGLAGVVSRQVRNGAATAATAAAGIGKTGGSVSGKGKGGMSGGISGMVGGQIYKSSVGRGGSFANDIIGRVATGSIAVDGTMDGAQAAEALQSYLGYTALGTGTANVPVFTDVEIGGGRITGTETSAGHPDGIAFGMYNAAQYAAPEGAYDTVHTADGAVWYRQYAVDAVEKSPYMAADGSIAYNESIVKKLPPVPKRKDRI